MNLTRPHISCDGRFKSKGEIVTSIYLGSKYPVSIAICSNLERPCYISSPDLAWVLGMFRQRPWNKIPHTRDVTRWVVSTVVYKATLGSFCNVREVGIWQGQSTLQYFASTSVSGNVSATWYSRAVFQFFCSSLPSFLGGTGGRQKRGSWRLSLPGSSYHLCLPDLFCYSKTFSKMVGNTKEKRNVGSTCFVLLQPRSLFAICSFNRLAGCLEGKTPQADASYLSVRLMGLTRGGKGLPPPCISDHFFLCN